MASVTGSRLAFYSSTVTADKVNVVLTTDGSDVAGKAIAGDFNIEVFTVTAAALASGFQASAYVQGAQQLTNNAIQAGLVSSTEELLDGSYTLIDLSGGSARAETITIGGPSPPTGASDVVVGSDGDTIYGSPSAAVSQVIDASGTNKNANPGPFAGAETVFGGAGGTTVSGGKGDKITGGTGGLQVNDAKPASAGGETINGASSFFDVFFDLGPNDSIVGSNVGTTFINDQYGSGGNSSIVGGSGTGTISVKGIDTGANTIIFAASGDKVTVGSALSAIDGSKGSVSIQGGNGTVTGSPVGATGFNTAILSGMGDVLTLGSAKVYVESLFAGANTVNAGAGFAHVDAGAGTSVGGSTGGLEVNAPGGAGTVTGGSGNLFVFNIGKSEVVTGATGGTTLIDDGYGNGGNSTLTGGSGASTFTVTIGGSAVALNTEIVGAPGDKIAGSGGTTYIDGILGSQSITAGSGATTVQAAAGDTVNSGSGTLQVFLDSDQATTTVNLGAGHGAAKLSDVSVIGGAGSTISVTGFATATDVIQSPTPGAVLVATSTKDGSGNVVLHFLDKSTMTVAGVTDASKITFQS